MELEVESIVVFQYNNTEDNTKAGVPVCGANVTGEKGPYVENFPAADIIEAPVEGERWYDLHSDI